MAPRRRVERNTSGDKDAFEKGRLKQRRGGFGQYEEVGSSVIAVAETSSAYIEPRDRFLGDFASEDKFARQMAAERRAQELARKREEASVREAARWAAMEIADKEEQDRLARNREDGMKARRNKSGTPYDPVSLEYHHDEEGEALRYQDDAARARAAARASILASKSRSTDYNLLNGAAIGTSTTTSTRAAPGSSIPPPSMAPAPAAAPPVKSFGRKSAW